MSRFLVGLSAVGTVAGMVALAVFARPLATALLQRLEPSEVFTMVALFWFVSFLALVAGLVLAKARSRNRGAGTGTGQVM